MRAVMLIWTATDVGGVIGVGIWRSCLCRQGQIKSAARGDDEEDSDDGERSRRKSSRTEAGRMMEDLTQAIDLGTMARPGKGLTTEI